MKAAPEAYSEAESSAAERLPLRSAPAHGESRFRRWPQYVAIFFASLGAMSAGLVGGWTSNAVPELRERGLPEPQLAWVGALPAAGALFGALPAGLLAARLGRRLLLMFAAVPCAVAWLLVYFATRTSVPQQVWLLHSGRALSGLAMGAATAVAPLYAEESCDVAVRGRLGVTQNLLIDTGILAAYVLGAAGASFEVQTLAPLAVPLLQLAGMLWIPESPAHLAARSGGDALRRAPRAARWLRLELDPLERHRRERLARGGKATPPFRARWRALVIVLGLMIFRQLLGINAFIYYTVDIFEESGSTLSPEMATLTVGIVQFLATSLSGVLVEHAGRRPLLLVSGCLAVLSNAALAVSESSLVPESGWLPMLAVNLIFVAFSIGFGSLPWFITAEVAPGPDAAWMTGLAVAANWSMIFTVTKGFPECIVRLGAMRTFALLSATSGVATLFALLFVPETRGLPRDAIQRELLEGGVVVLRCGRRRREEAHKPLADDIAATALRTYS